MLRTSQYIQIILNIYYRDRLERKIKNIKNNQNNIENIFEKEIYNYSIEGDISYILSSRLGVNHVQKMLCGDEMDRMRIFRENGDNISNYYSLNKVI